MRPSKQAILRWVKENGLMIATIVGVLVGILVGFALHFSNVKISHDGIVWIKLWGELFLRMLNLVILPLVMSCIIVGVASMESKASGRMGLVAMIYIFVTQLISVTLGIILSIAIHPGKNLGGAPVLQDSGSTSYTDVFADLLRNLIPGNIVRAALQNAYTERTETMKYVEILGGLNGTNVTGYENVTEVASELLYRDGVNIMGIVVISIALGLGISAAGEAGKPLYKIFQALLDVIFKIMNAIFWYSPIGIASLIAGAIVEVENLSTALTSVGMFVLTVVLSNAIYQFVIAPILMGIILRTNPFKLHLAFVDAIMAACAPPAGAAGLPFLLKDCKEKLGLDERIVNFVQPIINAINRVGSAMFIVTAGVFVSQTYGITLNVGQYFTLGLLVVFLSGAVAAVPSSSLVVLLMVSRAVGFPVADRMGLLVMVDWFNDRVRTTTNTISHGYGTIIVHHFCHKYLTADLDKNENNQKLTTENNEENVPLKQNEAEC